MIVQIQLGDGRWLVGGGAYEDEYRREAGVWRIARRTVSRPFDLPPIPGGDHRHRRRTAGAEPTRR